MPLAAACPLTPEPLHLDCTGSYDCDGVAETKGQLCIEGSCADCSEDVDCVRVAHYGAGATCQAGRCVHPEPPDSGPSSTDASTCRGDDGDFGCACFGNQTCNHGLTCVDGMCTGAAPGSEGGACFANRTCLSPLVCDTDDVCRTAATDAGVGDGGTGVDAAAGDGGDGDAGNGDAGDGDDAGADAGSPDDGGADADAGVDAGTADPCTGQIGERSCACFANSTCFGGLACVDGRCTGPDTGTLDGPCYANRTCNAGLECDVDDVCQPEAGSRGGDCVAELICNTGLVCRSGVCGEAAAGEVGGVCLVGNQCLPELVCDAGAGMCRAPVTCAFAGCKANQLCQPSSSSSDAVCLEACRPGYSWGAALECLPVEGADCSRSGALSILAACAAIHEDCVDTDGPAHCGDCLSGFVRDEGQCRAVVTCELLACGNLDRSCAPESTHTDAACGACRAPYADNGTGTCVHLTLESCDAALSLGTVRDACSVENRYCLDGPARCGACFNGFTADASDNCTPSMPLSGVASRLVFTTQPSGVSVSTGFSVVIEVQDGLGVRVPAATQQVKLALFPVGVTGIPGQLSGNTQVDAVAGTATFEGLTIDRAGSGYALVASSTGIASAFSVGFDVAPPPPTPRLQFSVEPANGVPNIALAPPVQVRLLDANGNLDPSSGLSVTLALASNPSGATLGGTLTKPLAVGVAYFPDLTIDLVGSGYTLAATTMTAGVSDATSAAFSIANASRPSFVTQPSNVAPGVSIAPPVQVELLDGDGNRDTAATALISIALGTNPGAGTLSGTMVAQPVSGVATFSDLSINNLGDGYTLVATAALPGSSPATSNSFNVTTSGQRLAFLQQPSNKPINAPIPVQIELLNAAGTRLTGANDTVTITLANNPSGATLSGTRTAAAVSGVATFNDLTIDQQGAAYTLRATATSFEAATSQAFSVGTTTPAGSKLVFAVQPPVSVAATDFSVSVEVRDGNETVITAATDAITLSLFTNAVNGTLVGTLTRDAVAGRADFPGLSIGRAGNGYSLVATASGIDVGFSVAFDIVPGEPALFRFRQQPTGVIAGEAISPTVEVELLDAGGNLVSSATDQVTLSVATGNSPSLLGTTTVAAIGGIAAFPGIRLERTGTHRLRATASGVTDLDSYSFTVFAATAVRLVFLQQPSNGTATAYITPAITVVREDAFGNTVTGSGFAITLAIGDNPGSATLNGATTLNTNGSGIATFNVSLNKVGTGYTLLASGSNVSPGTSDTFSIAHGVPASMVFAVPPSDVVAGDAIAPAVQVQLLDAGGNVADTATNAITIAKTSSTGTLSGTLVVNAVAGVATFSDLSITGTGNVGAKTLRASGVGPAVNSTSFNVSHAAPDHVIFTNNASSATAGVAMSPALNARVRDRFNNPCTTYTGTVTVDIGTNPSGGVLLGEKSVDAVDGDASFSDVRIDKAGTGYTVTATAAGAATPGTSTAFNIFSAAPAKLGFTVQPASTRSMAMITPAVQITAQDQFGNYVGACCGEYTVQLATGGVPLGTLFGTSSVQTVGRIATFSNLRFDNPGNYTLVASNPTLGTVTSDEFAVTAGGWADANEGLDAATTLSIAVDPVTPSIMYAASLGGGMWKSVDGGATWTSASIGLRNRYVRAIAIDPTTPTTVYAGTNYNAFKSTNSGATWVELRRSADGCCDQRIRQILVSRSNQQVIWLVKEDNVVRRSTDGGDTWADANGSVSHLVIDLTNDQVAYGTAGGRVYRTANGGGSGWSDVSTGLPQPVTSIAIDPATPTTLYAGLAHGAGVYRTVNSGTDWTAANTGLTPTGFASNVSMLAISPSSPGTLYAYYTSPNASFDNTLWRTTDSGASWTAAPAAGRLTAVLQTMVVHAATPGTLFIGLDGGAVYKSTDSGDNFVRWNSGIHAARISRVSVDPSDANILYAATEGGGGFKSVDGGAQWTQLAGGLPAAVLAIAAAKSNGQVLYAITSTLAFRSTDGGASWTQVHAAPSTHTFSSLAIDPTNADIAYLAHRKATLPLDGNIAKTTDGTTFTAQSPSIGTPVSAVTIDPQNPLSVWVACDSAQSVFHSLDAGATAFVGKGSSLGTLRSVVIDPALGTTVYVSSADVRKTSDSAASPPAWAAVSTGLPTTFSFFGLAIDPTASSTLFVGGWGGTNPDRLGSNVYRTTDGGTAWSFAGAGLSSELINWIEHAPATTEIVWAGTEGAGVFKTTSGGQ